MLFIIDVLGVVGLYLGFGIAAVVILLDQLTKYWVLYDLLKNRSMIIYTSYFNLVRAWNTGVSFSMFNGWGVLGVIALSLVSLTIVVFLALWMRKEKSRLIKVALGFIIGGALCYYRS